ncbi:hypothetical protein HHO41_13700 [Bacillus sp. DNRA2]|uniref:hypothetical protein n=1 Tax=Bacillus sp. DNRA2 TaxID=2723053 RepID=UPI00145DD375|nr:hypothetical protein [Bacillus sp. DNRA2]NMD71354.1 hypothetical protein [Bacillus sp. DNRA2]
MALDEPREQDTVSTVNGIQVAIDPIIKPHADRTTLAYNAEINGLILQGPDFGDSGETCGC